MSIVIRGPHEDIRRWTESRPEEVAAYGDRWLAVSAEGITGVFDSLSDTHNFIATPSGRSSYALQVSDLHGTRGLLWAERPEIQEPAWALTALFRGVEA